MTFWPATREERRNFLKNYDEVSNLFGNLWEDFDNVFGDVTYQDKDGNYIREIECPGFNKENLNVEISEGILTIKGERTTGDEYSRKLFKRYRLGTFETVDAEIKDGILYLKFLVPKEKKQKIDLK